MKINFFLGDVKRKLISRLLKSIFRLFFISCFLFLAHQNAYAAEIIGPVTNITNNEIYVTTGVVLDEKLFQELKNGISKEITFYIDLFRVWNAWPDEFILGKIITKTLKCDPIKNEFVATSFDGITKIERRFKNIDSLMKWALNINNLLLTNIKELESDNYFIRITAESRVRRLPPVIGHLFFFVPESEFKLVKDSESFYIRIGK